MPITFAEQWEFGLGDAQASKSEKKLAFRRAKAFREVRLRRWGGTQYEQLCREAQSIEIFPRNTVMELLGKNESR